MVEFIDLDVLWLENDSFIHSQLTAQHLFASLPPIS